MLRSLFNPNKKKRLFKPLKIETIYQTSNNNLFNNPTTPEQILDKIRQHPEFKHSSIQTCPLEVCTSFIGFKKNKTIEGHIIVYPYEVYTSLSNMVKWNRLITLTEEHGSIGELMLVKSANYYSITDDDGIRYIVKPQDLKPIRWLIEPCKQDQSTGLQNS